MNVGVDKNVHTKSSKAVEEICFRGTKKISQKKKQERLANEKEILERILWNEPDGRSTGELSFDTGLHRDTVYDICEDLIKREIIVKPHKKGKYHLADGAYRHSKIRNSLYKMKIMNTILKWHIPISKENAFCKINNDPDPDQLSLFLFTNRIGACIAFVMMEAIRPGKYTPILPNNIHIDTNASGKIRDQLALQWIQDLLEPKGLLWLFFKISILGGLDIRGTAAQPPPIRYERPTNYPDLSKGEREKIDKEIEETIKTHRNYLSESMYEVDKSKYTKLVKTFKKLYPGIYDELKLIPKNLDDEIKRQISYSSDWKHTKCEGKIKIISENPTEKIEQCQKCKRLFRHIQDHSIKRNVE